MKRLLSIIRPGTISLLLALFATSGTAVSLEERITDYQLPNGLQVVIYVDSSAPVVATHVWYRVGSYHEPPGLTGISHMTEHMVFKRSPAWPDGRLHSLVREHGGMNNGFTSTYYTGYFEEFSSDRWELALEIEAGRMAACRFVEEDFRPEKGVVTEEWRLGDNNPSRRLWSDFSATAFQANPQRNPVIGWPADIHAFTRDAVEEWYQTWYTPGNAILIIAGDVRPDEVKPLVKKHFGGIKNRPVPEVDFYDSEPDQRGTRRIEVRMPTSAPLLYIGYRMPGRRDTTGYHAAAVAAAVLGEGRLSRLYRRLVIETRLATAVSSWPRAQSDPGLLMVSITPTDAENIPEIKEIVSEEVQRLANEPVSEPELNRIHNRLAADEVFSLDTPGQVARIIALHWATAGSWREYELGIERTRRISADEVMSFAREWLRPDFRTIGVLLPPDETTGITR